MTHLTDLARRSAAGDDRATAHGALAVFRPAQRLVQRVTFGEDRAF